MKLLRILESIAVPVALSCVGWCAAPLAMRCLGLLGRTYSVSDIMTPYTFTTIAPRGALIAGLVALVVQRKKTGRQRWKFYGLIAATMPVSVALLVAIEAIRLIPAELATRTLEPGMRLQYDLSGVPVWILAAGFGGPFLLLLRKSKPAEPPELPARDPRTP